MTSAADALRQKLRERQQEPAVAIAELLQRLLAVEAAGGDFAFHPIKHITMTRSGDVNRQTLYENKVGRPLRLRVRVVTPADPTLGAPEAEILAGNTPLGLRLDLAVRGSSVSFLLLAGYSCHVAGRTARDSLTAAEGGPASAAAGDQPLVTSSLMVEVADLLGDS